MNMRKKIARALARRHYRRMHMAELTTPVTAEVMDAYAEQSWIGYMDDAIAVLDALHEPTLEMGDKMRDMTGAGYPYSPDPIPPLGHLQIGLIWRTGIDAAKAGS